ncbi:MAG: glycogen synthase, partial [Mariprofundales bacterium]
VEQDDLYDRDHLYGPPGGAYADNLLRFVLLNRVVLELAATAATPFDIIHCHDWQTGLIPLLLNHQYRHLPALANTRTVFTIHNLAYQGVFSADGVYRMGLPTSDYHTDGYEFYHQINCLKAGVMASDAVTTVSPTYASEILTAEYGCHLEGFLGNAADKLSGIVNGLDVAGWDPATDKHISSKFSSGKVAGKARCKRQLQKLCKLTEDAAAPLLVTISRLADQKGIDLLVAAAPVWLEAGAQLVVLGSGDSKLEQQLQTLAEAYPQQCGFHQGFNEPLARKIYAGADFFMMPSRFEPCGLGQLMAMRYGAIPVVRATGGLSDTVIDMDADPAYGTGFHFAEATVEALVVAGQQAMAFRADHPQRFDLMVGRALSRDSSWNPSAQTYEALYAALLTPPSVPQVIDEA